MGWWVVVVVVGVAVSGGWVWWSGSYQDPQPRVVRICADRGALKLAVDRVVGDKARRACRRRRCIPELETYAKEARRSP